MSPGSYVAVVAELDVDHPRKVYPLLVGSVDGIVKDNVEDVLVDVFVMVLGPPDPPLASK